MIDIVIYLILIYFGLLVFGGYISYWLNEYKNYIIKKYNIGYIPESHLNITEHYFDIEKVVSCNQIHEQEYLRVPYDLKEAYENRIKDALIYNMVNHIKKYINIRIEKVDWYYRYIAELFIGKKRN